MQHSQPLKLKLQMLKTFIDLKLSVNVENIKLKKSHLCKLHKASVSFVKSYISHHGVC